jgi:acyl carrier protein
MDDKKILEVLNDIFKDIFDDDTLEIAAETTQEDIEEWDSLANINIVFAVEDEFDIKFDVEEITKMKSVAVFIDEIKKKLA